MHFGQYFVLGHIVGVNSLRQPMHFWKTTRPAFAGGAGFSAGGSSGNGSAEPGRIVGFTDTTT